MFSCDLFATDCQIARQRHVFGFGCRFEIEKKLRQQKRLERARDKPFARPRDKERDKSRKREDEKLFKEKTRLKEADKEAVRQEDEEEDQDASRLQLDFSSIDHKERSKERKKNIEENRGKTDNKRWGLLKEA